MQKIPTVFLRDPNDMRRLLTEVHPECQWVLDGEGVPTRKYDGTCVMFDGEKWWARREVKKGKEAPPNWIPVEVDDTTGKKMGWEPIAQSGYYHAWQDAYINLYSSDYEVGTYELIGPKINGNPEKLTRNHEMIKHSDAEKLAWTVDVPASYGALAHMVQYLAEEHGWEGIVWHHPDGRMAKLKGRDFHE